MRILTLNSGSSSIKFALFDTSDGEQTLLSGQLQRIGQQEGGFSAKADGKPLADEKPPLADHAAALRYLLDWLPSHQSLDELNGVSHRLVHGGPEYTEPLLVTNDLREKLRGLIPWAPEHLPHELAAIEELMRLLPKVPQIGCFDTAFHRTMPNVAQMYSLPERLRNEGLRRYGFHGLSYEYIVSLLRETGRLPERLIVAHLGNGASLAAIRRGESVDTSMGLTPTAGLVMSTRSGDLDPGILLHLLRERHIPADELEKLIDHEGGLKAISGTSSDMRDLLEKSVNDPAAADAVEAFCYSVKKTIGSYVAVLGGLDMLVFTGGIGEHAAPVRQKICAGLDGLGLRIDAGRNAGKDERISDDDSVPILVLATNEELMMARHAVQVLERQKGRQ